jgi:hypothetical protein
MTNSQPHRKPTPGQLSYLRDLAMKTGQSFAFPQSFAAASAEIERLLGEKRMSAAERRRETRAVRADMAERRGGASAVRDEELDGYGSTAGWRRGS